MVFNITNINNINDITSFESYECIYIIAIYITISFFTKHYRDNFKDYSVNSDDSDDEYGGVICI